MTQRPPHQRLFRFAALALSLAVGLSGCGRRTALDLPPDVQAQGAATAAAQRDAETQKSAAKTKASGKAAVKPKLSEEGASAPPLVIPGTTGHRPPGDYPFLLDPLL